jgi:hypothetical protein
VLRASLIEQNYDVGVFLADSAATIESSVVRATRVSPAGTPFGDGLTAEHLGGKNTATIIDAQFLDNARAGLVLVRAHRRHHRRASFGQPLRSGPPGQGATHPR